MPMNGRRREMNLLARLRAALEAVSLIAAKCDAKQLKPAEGVYEVGQIAAKALQKLRGS